MLKFLLVVTLWQPIDGAGHDYVVDTDLTMQDCMAQVAALGADKAAYATLAGVALGAGDSAAVACQSDTFE